MRQLTKKQKNLLTLWYNKQKPKFYEDLTDEQIQILKDINDFEDLYQAIDRFLWDIKD